MTTLNPRPYTDSIDHLRDEVEGWVTARCHHLVAKKELAEAEMPPIGNISVVGRGEATATEELRRRIARLAGWLAGEIHARAEPPLRRGAPREARREWA